MSLPNVRTHSKLGHTTVTTEPGAAAIHAPQLEGDSRANRPATPDLFDELYHLPHHVLESNRLLTDLRNQVAEALERQIWANTADISNTAQTGTVGGAGVDAYAKAMIGYTGLGAGVEVRNAVVGTSAAAVVQLVAARAEDLAVGPTLRRLATIRTVSTALSQWVLVNLWLLPGENLFLVAKGLASVNFDFSAEYRILRAQ